MSVADVVFARLGSRRALLTLSSILFLTFLDTTIMSVALEDLQSTLHTTVSEIQWIVNAYALLFAALMLAFGTLGDRLGRRRVMLMGVGIFVAGSVFGALAPNTGSLIAARGIMGIGAAACEPGTLSILRHLYPDRGDRARALGLWAAIAGLALAMGPVIGGILVGVGGWRAIFWFNLAAGVLVFVGAAWVPESADPEKGRFDFVGFFLGPISLGTIVFAIIVGETAGYRAPHVIALFAIGIAAGALFAFVETRVKAPILEVRYFRKAPFAGSLFVAFATYFGVFSIFFLTALYLQVVLAYTAYRTATLFVPMAIAMIIASSFAGRWVARVGPRLPVAVGCVAAGAGVLLTDLALRGSGAPYVPLILSLTLAGVGFGIAVVPITSVALSILPARHSGMAASATTTAREVGTVVGVAALGSLFNTQLTNFLTQRLIELQVPPQFREIVITAVLTGQVPAGSAEAEAQYGPIVTKVIGAAYEAVHSGVSISLLVAGCVILASGIVAYFTFSLERLSLD